MAPVLQQSIDLDTKVLISSPNMHCRIGTTEFEICNVKDNQSLFRLVPFLVEETYNNCYQHTFDYRESLCLPDDVQCIITGNECNVYEDEKNYYFVHHADAEVYAICIENKISLDHTIQVYNDIFDHQLHYYVLLHFLHLERMFARNDGFILHATFIEKNGKAILFTADSGGGKSTQADLWVENAGARLINGDKVLIQRINGVFYACGLPFSGSSNVYLNEKYPIVGIACVNKWTENLCYEIGLQGFRKIHRQMVGQSWDPEYSAKLMDFIIDLCSDVKIFDLLCTKDQKAVDCFAAVMEDLLYGK